MGGTNGVNGSGNNFYKVSDFWSKPSLQAAKTEQAKLSQPIKLTSDNVKREELGLVNPYNSSDVNIAESREIASNTNKIMEQLGFNFKVTPKAVASVADGLNNQTIPALNTADDNAVAARVATPKGPFADLFA